MSDTLFAPEDTSPSASASQPLSPNRTQVLYRKWRPQLFAEVAGQDAITRTLRNSIASGNIAHAYLLFGPRGTGKTTLGRLLAKAVNCDAPNDGEPCNGCESCRAFVEGRALDFIEQDAASHNSVDDIRQLRENVVLTPMSGRRKVYLLDEVHMLSPAAENALLKTLEEPPPHIVFVLATTEAHKVAGTIVSRCQRFDLKRISLASVAQRLATISASEGFTIDEESLDEIARSATGSLRDAINSLEQIVTYYGTAPTPDQVRDALGLSEDARSGQFARAALSGDVSESLRLLSAVRDDGVDIKHFTSQVVQYLRGLLMAKAGVAQSLGLSRDMADEVKREAGDTPQDSLLRALKCFGSIDWSREGAGAGSSVLLELALLETCAQISQPVQAPTPPAATTQAVPEPTTEVVTQTEVKPEGKADPESPQPAIATGDGHGDGDDDVLDRVRTSLRPSDKQLAALLNGSCEVKAIEDDRVTLGFFHTFHLERVEQGGLREPLEKAFQSVLGRPVSVVCEHTPRGPADEKPAEPGGHLVQVARERHGARAVPKDQ